MGRCRTCTAAKFLTAAVSGVGEKGSRAPKRKDAGRGWSAGHRLESRSSGTIRWRPRRCSRSVYGRTSVMSDRRVLLAGRGIPPLNDVTPLPPGRKLLGVVAFVIPALILMSMPDGMSSATRTSCVVLIWERSDLPARPQRTNTALFEVHRLKVTPGAGKAASCVRRLADQLHRSCEQR
jgi:hypothetical protein